MVVAKKRFAWVSFMTTDDGLHGALTNCALNSNCKANVRHGSKPCLSRQSKWFAAQNRSSRLL
jgi:hypothetical protein